MVVYERATQESAHAYARTLIRKGHKVSVYEVKTTTGFTYWKIFVDQKPVFSKPTGRVAKGKGYKKFGIFGA